MKRVHIHFMGIGGSGASAIAAIAQRQGFKVTGCDISLNSEFLKPFTKRTIRAGHSHKHPAVSQGVERQQDLQ